MLLTFSYENLSRRFKDAKKRNVSLNAEKPSSPASLKTFSVHIKIFIRPWTEKSCVALVYNITPFAYIGKPFSRRDRFYFAIFRES